MEFAGLVDPATGQHPFFWLGIATAVLSFLVAYLAVSRNQKRFSVFFAAFMMSQGIWAIGDVLILAFVDVNLMIIVENFRKMAQFSYALFWLAFVFEFTHADRFFNRKYVIASLILPVFVTVSYWTNPLFELMYTDASLISSGPVMVLYLEQTTLGSLTFVTMLLYAYIGIAWLVKYSIQAGTRMHRKQGVLVMLTGLIVSTGGTLSYLDLHPYPNAYFTTTVFIIGSIPLFWAFYGHQFLSVVPIARREVVQGMSESLLVVDSDNTVIDTNTEFNKLFVADGDVLGRDITDAFPSQSTFYKDVAENAVAKSEFEYTVDGETKFMKVRQSPLTNSKNAFVGRVFLFEDITTERTQKLELKQQNERLDKFASVVSHDLRNPLAAAMGYTDVVREQVDDEQYVETIDRNLDRMDTMIDEVLEISRQGTELENPEITSGKDLVETAWTFVDNEDATLVVEGDMQVETEPERLQRAFENLMRNSIDHGGRDVTVEIGFEDGLIYLEDTGPGVPDEHRDGLFEFGKTHSDDGTGFGLSIVQSIIQAHGWEIDVVDPQNGSGARFEIRGVDDLSDVVDENE